MRMSGCGARMSSLSGVLKFKRPIDAVSRDEQGAVLILFALVLPAILIAAMLVVDYGGMGGGYRGPFRELTEMQAVADAAARSGAMVRLLRDSTPAMVKAEAFNVAGNNNYDQSLVAVNVGSEISFGAYKDRENAVEVVVTRKNYKFPFLAGDFGLGSGITLQARAVALWLAAPCIVALNTQSHAQIGIDFSGAKTNINASCGLYSNYPGSQSIKATSGTVCADKVIMVGSLSGSIGPCDTSTGQTIVPNVTTPFPDPFNSLDLTPKGTQVFSEKDTAWDSVNILSPGTYLNGIHLRTGAHTLEAGVYYFPANTEFITDPSASIIGNGPVTLVFEPATKANAGGFSFNGPVTLKAPNTGDFRGLVIASKGTTQNQGFNSTSAAPNLDGGIYAPYSQVNFNAPITNANNCLVIFADSVSFNGGPVMGKQCLPDAMNLGGFLAAGLVE